MRKQFWKLLSCLFLEGYMTLLIHFVKIFYKQQYPSLSCELHDFIHFSYYYEYKYIIYHT